MGYAYDYLIRQVAEEQSPQYYCSTQRHSGVDTSIGTPVPSGPNQDQDLAHEIKRIHRATRVTVKPIVIFPPGIISWNA